MTSKVSKLHNKDVIKQANPLTTATYSLTKNEKRLVYLAINAISKQLTEQNSAGSYPIVIDHEQYRKIFRYDDNKNICRDIGNASLGLNRKEVIFYIPDEDLEEEKALDALSWTTKRSHRPKKGITTIYFNPELVELLKNNTKNYTQLLLGDLAKLDKPSSMRLYESLKQWQQKGEVTFSISWMIEHYQLSEKYIDRLSDFRRRFLKPAIDEINKKTSLTVEAIELKKKGKKKPHAILFKIETLISLKDTGSLTIEDAVKTFLDIKENKFIPTILEIENLKLYRNELVKDGFEYDELFNDLLSESEIRARDLMEFNC